MAVAQLKPTLFSLRHLCPTISGHRYFWTAHRVAYFFTYDFLPPHWTGYVVDHTCHRDSTCRGGKLCLYRRCVRPDHLTLATRQANTRYGRGPHVLYAAGYTPKLPDHRRAGSSCSVDHCLKPELSAGFCSAHYFRW
jgi:hypothetical protein